MHVRFGEFTLDTDTRQVIGVEGEIHLSPKAYELLKILVDNRFALVGGRKPAADLPGERHGLLFGEAADAPQ